MKGSYFTSDYSIRLIYFTEVVIFDGVNHEKNLEMNCSLSSGVGDVEKGRGQPSTLLVYVQFRVHALKVMFCT